MTKIIDFTKHKEKKEDIEKIKNKGTLLDQHIDFEYKYLADYNARELYINVSFQDFDINVDVGVNLEILSQLAAINPMTKLTKRKIREITNLEQQFVIAIYETYRTFGFIDSETKMIRSLNDIKDSYIENRLKRGYPKNKKSFDQVLALEKEVFSSFCKDTSDFNDDLYWKAENKY